MARFRGLVFAALCAGLIAGAVLSLMHLLAVVPLIQIAEQWEAAGGHASHGAAHSGWRAGLTVAADLLAGVGFALLLCAGLALRGGAVSVARGTAWGLAGFVAFALAPALGLPPELPSGAVEGAGAVALRQIWWLMTVMATSGGMALLAFGARPARWPVGLALLVLPHLALPVLLGASPPEAHGGAAPMELARWFMAAAIASNLLFWLVLGPACALGLRRFMPDFNQGTSA